MFFGKGLAFQQQMNPSQNYVVNDPSIIHTTKTRRISDRNTPFLRQIRKCTPGILYESIRQSSLLTDCRCPRCGATRKKAGEKEGSVKFYNSLGIRKLGIFSRKSDNAKIQRYYCYHCRRSFSVTTGSLLRYMKRRDYFEGLFLRFTSGTSMRRISREYGISRNTVAHALKIMGRVANREHKQKLTQIYGENERVAVAQIDELITFESTLCKPLTVPVCVDANSKRILSYAVGKAPPQSKRAKIAQGIYGHRNNQRMRTLTQMIMAARSTFALKITIDSDQCPLYPEILRKNLGDDLNHNRLLHRQYRSRKAAITGQGEMKTGGFDPLFAINHTLAMLRSHVSRIQRRTWNTTKKRSRLWYHLAIAIYFINWIIIPLRQNSPTPKTSKLAHFTEPVLNSDPMPATETQTHN